MNFKKLQAMQAKLDEAILAEKAQMTEEERFNKTLVALSVEIAEVANCAEHFKFWKDNKGKVDSERFGENHFFANNELVFTDYIEEKTGIQYEFEQAHRLTLVEECSDALHFILSLANQIEYEIKDIDWEVLSETKEKNLMYINRDLFYLFTSFDRGQSSSVNYNNIQMLLLGLLGYFESLGITEQELEQAYYDKNKINYERLENGY
ncbi:dUTP diphosphatase [Jeotgalibaca porci]|uniref:dUTP diphosphatase n=1 Tax=Jeotgalibaca porci TaxID=1868793 RepID=UPI00359F5534